jgi:hypothetical protein
LRRHLKRAVSGLSRGPKNCAGLTLYCLIISTRDGDVRHLGNLETVCMLRKGVEKALCGRLGTDSASNRVASVEKGFDGAGGDVPIGASDQDQALARHGVYVG